MASQKGRDFLIKISDGNIPPNFEVLGAARTNKMTINNNPVDDTAMDSQGVQSLAGDAGVQTMDINIDGLFKDAAAEENLRSAAFTGTANEYQLVFPNGDVYQAAFVIRDYTRGGSYDGLESFSATLTRAGAGNFTAA
jgi:TP901-1 family phage major tail protein